MSQVVKRHATEAFEDGTNDTPSKRRRVRNRTAHQTPANHVYSTSVQHKPITSSLVRSDKRSKTEKTSRPKVEVEVRADGENANVESRSTAAGKSDSTPPKTHKKRERKRGQHGSEKAHKVKASAKKSSTRTSPWILSAGFGGVFIDHDPIFTPDKQYLIIPAKDEVNIYSLSTSLLVRSLRIKETSTVLRCCISTTNHHHILVTTREGYIIAFDWTTGRRITKWQTRSRLTAIVPANGVQPTETVFCISSYDGRHELSQSSLEENEEVNSTSLLQASHLHDSIKTSPDESVIAVCGKNVIYIGHASLKNRDGRVQSTPHTWYRLSTAKLISSFDVRFVQPAKITNKNPWEVDVVIGHDNGSITLYANILSRLIQNSKGDRKVDLDGRNLHWHRGMVRSVKWSRDGKYLISGGDETVLVIWQLETNQQQFLPHLSSPILNIAISQSGAEYALRLGDNSVMVLSTADLSPMTNITGLSLPSTADSLTPLLLHPKESNRLLAAVSLRSVSSSNSSVTATHLQTFDIDTKLQLYRQALTRNITTAVNVAPTGQPIQEPNVTHMQISYDGQWLATVDEWSPDSLDLQALYLREDDQSAKQQTTETVLRFWSWNTNDNSWETVNRIDEPHQPSKFSVLGAASNPVTREFSTVGDDGMVKIWRPKRRIRDGVQVKDESGQPLYSWVCAHTVQIEPRDTEKSASDYTSATLSYSPDGSLLAASLSSQKRSVHFLNPRTGALCTSQANLLSEGPASTATIGRWLLCLSKDLKVFDIITLQVTFTMPLPSNHSHFLAANSRTSHFAIAVNPQTQRHTTNVSIFDIENLNQGVISDLETPKRIRTLLPDTVNGGFVLIDEDNRIRRITPPSGLSSSLALTAPNEVQDQPQKTFEDIFGADRFDTSAQQPKLIEPGTDQSRSLADLISVASTAGQLGIKELFDRVSRAVSGPRVAVGA